VKDIVSKLGKVRLPEKAAAALQALLKALPQGYPAPYGYYGYAAPGKGVAELVVELIAALQEALPGLDREEAEVVRKALGELKSYAAGPEREAASPAVLDEAARVEQPVEGTEGLRWEIIALESGYTRPFGRRFYKPETVERAAPLFEGARVFLDHMTEAEEAARPEGSVRDLVGWLRSPRVVKENGVTQLRATFEVLASATDFTPRLREAYERGRPDLFQFSIRAMATTRWERQHSRMVEVVESLDSILSVDVVTAGAAGGRVVRMVASQEQEDRMQQIENLTLDELKALRPDLVEALGKSPEPEPGPPQEEARLSEGEQQEQKTEPPAAGLPEGLKALESELSALKRELAESRYREELRKVIAGSDLPQVAKDRFLARFSGEITDMARVREAIEEERAYLASLANAVPRSLPEAPSAGEDQVDKFAKALDGMVRGEPVDGVRPFRSLAEAYCRIKGYDPYEGDPIAVVNALTRELSRGFSSRSLGRKGLRESIASGDWTEALGDSLTRQLIAEYQMEDKWNDWRRIVSRVSHLSDTRTQRRVLLGHYGSAPTVGEGTAYPPAVSPPDQEITYSLAKKGMLEAITQEAMLRDDLGALQALPKRMGQSLRMAVYRSVFDIFTSNPTLGLDGTALFDASHNNTGTSALSFSALGAVRTAMRKQKALVATGETAVIYPGFVPAFVLVPPDLEQQALMIRNSDTVPATPSATGATPSHTNIYKGTFEVIVVDHWTDTNDWYCVADPKRFPTIEVAFLGNAEEPELLIEASNAGSSFTADKIVYKARLWHQAAPLDFRPFYRQQVA
jgi:hypothetical protein